MNEPAKDNSKPPKRSKRRPAMEPLGWDEIVSQPGMGGYLSFLNGPVPLPHLQGAATAIAPDPGVVSGPRIETAPEISPRPEAELTPVIPPATGAARPETTPDPVSLPEAVPGSGIDPNLKHPRLKIASAPGPVSIPGVNLVPGDIATPGQKAGPIAINDLGFVRPDPGVVSIPAVPVGQRLRIRRCAATHDGHSLGEEVLYQALWKAAHPESADTRTIVIGWRGMSQLCRMTPKNCKINTQRLIRKLALEVLSPYNTPESIGTTYRVYSDQAIFERRREAGLEWVVRSRGVEFVDPATGVSILPICAQTYQNGPPLI